MMYDKANDCTCVPVGDCIVPARTIKDNIEETEAILNECIALVVKLRNFLWAEENPANENGVSVKSMDSAIVSNMVKSKTVLDVLNDINRRIGVNG